MTLTIKCEWCGKEFQCYPSRFKNNKHHCCSKECINNLQKQIRESNPNYYNCTCYICGKKFHLKPYIKNKSQHVTCSKKCDKEYKKERMIGRKNHQYGLTGEKNSSWKGGKHINSYGYYLIYIPEHPFCNSDGYVFEHRLIAEQYLLNEENSIEINGKKYLKPEYEVHHIDENRLNNDVSNLMVVTRKQHQKIHYELNPRKRNEKGQFI